jgi:hypothetical protein
MASLEYDCNMLLHGPVSSGHAQKCLSVKPLYLPDITAAAENGTIQQPITFHTSVNKFCNTLKLRFLHFLNNILGFDL